MVKLGLGCIGIGRKWGAVESNVPTEQEAITFLQEAYKLGIRYFDTAPAYGYSEERLGKFYKELSSEQQSTVTIATKFGEFWDFETSTPYRNFTYDKLLQSFDNSLSLLGKIDVLQIHGFTKEIWEEHSADLEKAFNSAKNFGVKKIGASISNPDGSQIVFEKDNWEVLQLPHNILRPYDSQIIQEAITKNKFLVINRPFAMGEVTQQSIEDAKRRAYQFVLKDIKEGVILTGTKSIEHLKENISLFHSVQTESMQ